MLLCLGRRGGKFYCHLKARPRKFSLENKYCSVGTLEIIRSLCQSKLNEKKETAQKWSVGGTYNMLQATIRKYGWVALGLHISVFISTFGGIYLALRNGMDGDHYLQICREYIPLLKNVDIHPEWGKLGLAYGMTAGLGPIRYLVTIFGTPRVYSAIHGKTLDH